MFQTVSLWRQIGVSIALNWIAGPFVSIGRRGIEADLTE